MVMWYKELLEETIPFKTINILGYFGEKNFFHVMLKRVSASKCMVKKLRKGSTESPVTRSCRRAEVWSGASTASRVRRGTTLLHGTKALAVIDRSDEVTPGKSNPGMVMHRLLLTPSGGGRAHDAI
jgi:hypothetical protein